MDEKQVLCACSAYEQKFYLNPRYDSLPSKRRIKDSECYAYYRCRRRVHHGV